MERDGTPNFIAHLCHHNRLVNFTSADKVSLAMNPAHSRGKISREFSTLAILIALLFASVLCVAPRLHEKLHRPSANHECAVTLIASGKYEQNDAAPVIVVPRPAVQFSKIPALNPIWVAPPFLGASIFEHAPPALS
jgi:hypothetical protein